jgi:hypothetical protein
LIQKQKHVQNNQSPYFTSFQLILDEQVLTDYRGGYCNYSQEMKVTGENEFVHVFVFESNRDDVIRFIQFFDSP